MHIFIRTPINQQIKLEVQPRSIVLEIKKAIEKHCGVPFFQQVLLRYGQEIYKPTVESCKLEDGDTLGLKIAPGRSSFGQPSITIKIFTQEHAKIHLDIDPSWSIKKITDLAVARFKQLNSELEYRLALKSEVRGDWMGVEVGGQALAEVKTAGYYNIQDCERLYLCRGEDTKDAAGLEETASPAYSSHEIQESGEGTVEEVVLAFEIMWL